MAEQRDVDGQGAARPIVAFYGDDNTGSTDAMESLARAGVPAVLFLAPPGPEALRRFPEARAVGIAGMTRQLAPGPLAEELGAALRSLAAFRPRLCHYKICSTFDSSPQVGSIGRGIEVGAEVFGTSPVPLVVGAPILRRYTVFGNLFATVGAETFRVDRHPTMSRHPITPMDEGDLRVHLARQTDWPMGLIDVLTLARGPDAVAARWDELAVAGKRIVLFDTLDDGHLATIGRHLWARSEAGPLYVVGSSGVGYALVPELRRLGLVPAQPPAPAPIREVPQVVVMSGSASPVTRGQLDHVLDGLPERARYAGIRLDVEALVSDVPARAAAAREAACATALDALARGRSVALYAARGPEDPAIARCEAAWRARHPAGAGPGRAIGQAQGQLLRAILAAHAARGPRLARVIVAGGDTSGHGARGLGVEALTFLAPTAPGSPLCRAHAADPLVDGIEIVLKGGQVGDGRYFERVRQGEF